MTPTRRRGLSYDFVGDLWRWEARRELWTFVSLPLDASDEIAAIAGDQAGGWGSLRVDARVGATDFRTSIFPGGEGSGYMLPVKRAVRDAEALELGAPVSATITLIDV
ncbi:uncharacterized protein DUF1905 [Frondihabitans sp. PhB188]|uniref:DUF1905 domain-containing protein n=1 Tax=Frondihabitans sp. PhB188 TaxID=2485200 RepID=UPI000F4977B2|nr:DUF1905 domain-containing protein [Frondihabitans sp. PhB188]ROQ38732.1 uncharacterized protein DUF1905 [Frondihabitans sp. PhB188]